MTKVKESKARKTGTASVAGAEQKALEGRKMITAERNGEKRNFTALTWNNLPPDKEGWAESSDKPAEVSTEKKTKESVPLKPGKPEKPSVNENMVNHVITQDEKPSVNENMVDHVITQDDLDLDPELAKSGVKVGETIQIEKSKGGTE